MQYIKQLSIKLMMLLSITLLTFSAYAKTVDKKVLMVLSGYGQEQGNKTPGYEFDEFSKAYLVFKDNGIQIDIASPQGGKVEADKYDPNKPYNAKVLADKTAMNKLATTLATPTLNAKHYDGIFVVGGKGAMFDLPKDKSLQSLIADVYQQQGSIAAVCHGPAALVDVKLADGSYLVANKAVNSFTNQEEKLFGKKWMSQFEFMLQDKLAERGAKFQSSEIMLSHVAVDGRLITGQNPTSTVGVAVALVESLGLTPVAQAVGIEDKTMAVVAQYLAGDKTSLNQLAKQADEYHIPLVGMYGFYYLKVAQTPAENNNALALMLVAQEKINNPTLDMQIAKTQHKLGKVADAKATLEQLIKAKPDYQAASDMLKTL